MAIVTHPISSRVKPDALESLLQFTVERHQIFLRRLRGAPQADWTVDPYLRAGWFTNCFRVLDRCSQKLVEIIDEKQHGDFRAQLNPTLSGADTLFRIWLFRAFNKVSTWDHIINAHVANGKIGPWGTGLTRETFCPATAMGRFNFLVEQKRERLFHGAFTISTEGLPGVSPANGVYARDTVGGTGTGSLARRYLYAFADEKVFDWDVIEERVHDARDDPHALRKQLRLLPNCGPFASAQRTIDLGYTSMTRWHENQFNAPGFGCAQGAAAILGSSRFSVVDAAALIEWLVEEQDDLFMNAEFPYTQVPAIYPDGSHRRRTLTCVDWEHILCEFTRYTKAQSAHAYPRRQYKKPSGKAPGDNGAQGISYPKEWKPCR